MNDLRKNQDGRGAAEPPRVLLVEDDDEMRNMVAEAFRLEGWQVTECADAKRWFRSCVNDAATMDVAKAPEAANSYDVVVSDIRMPNMSGLDVLRILGDIHCADACPPTIFITAFGDEETHRRARELGAVTVLDKPFALRDLIDKVRDVTGV